MPQEDAEAFKTKAPIISSIKVLMARSMVNELVEEKEEVKRVATLEEKPNPSEDREVNKRWKDKASAMRDRLLSQEQVSILIPLETGERVGVVEWRKDKEGNPYQAHLAGNCEKVQLNGYKYMIPKGIYTKVPRQIAEVISNSQQQTLEAGSHISLDRIDPNTGKPFSDAL